jgi:hypothetical protein
MTMLLKSYGLLAKEGDDLFYCYYSPTGNRSGAELGAANRSEMELGATNRKIIPLKFSTFGECGTS